MRQVVHPRQVRTNQQQPWHGSGLKIILRPDDNYVTWRQRTGAGHYRPATRDGGGHQEAEPGPLACPGRADQNNEMILREEAGHAPGHRDRRDVSETGH
jgi:hypothetical protein